jgi:hypothetical protein
VVTGSFVIQTEIAYLPLVGGVGAVALVVWVVRLLRRRESPRTWRIPVAIAVGLFVLVWMPPTIDTLVNDPSNLDQLRSFQEDRHGLERQTVADGWRLATLGLSGFLDGRADISDDVLSGRSASWASVITVGAVAMASAVAIHRRRRNALVLVALLALAFAASVYAVSEVSGPLYNHLVTWNSVLSFMAWVAVGAALVPELERARAPRLMGAGVALLAGLVVAILIWPGIAPRDEDGSTIEALISRVERRVPNARSVVVRVGNDQEWTWATGLVAGLRDDGFDVHGERQAGAMAIVFEPRDLTDVQPGDAVVTVVGAPSECGTAELCVPTSR